MTDRRTDGRTDGQTDGIAVDSTALAMRALRRAVKTKQKSHEAHKDSVYLTDNGQLKVTFIRLSSFLSDINTAYRVDSL